MSSTNHYFTAGAFLSLVVLGLGYATRAGIRASLGSEDSSKPLVVDAPRGRKDLVKEVLKKELSHAARMFEEGRAKVGLRILERLSDEHPSNPTVWYNLGIARFEVRGADSARVAFMKVLEIDPEDWDAMAELASVEVAEGRLDEGVSLAGRIPVGEGRLASRLENDPRWARYAFEGGVRKLWEKHGLVLRPLPDSLVVDTGTTASSTASLGR